MEWTDILIPAAIFAGLGLVFGAALAIASRIFAVKVDERVTKITEALPGANCGGCGYAGRRKGGKRHQRGAGDPRGRLQADARAGDVLG